MSHSLQKLILSGVFVAVSATSAFAVPAKPGLLTMTQSDGSTLKVQLMGDERHHFYLSEDGYMLVEDKGDFYYADIDATGITVKSGIRAVPASQRSAEAVEYLSKVDMSHVYSVMTSRADAMHRSPLLSAPMHSASGSTNIDKGLFPDANFPVHGEQKAIVILVEYSDVKFTLEDPVDYFTRMLNEEGFSDYGGTGSATDFFTECSGGKFLPEFDVYGPVTLPQKQSYYGGNDWSGNDQHPEQMVVHACNILDPDVDFTQYDRDGDGYIDNVFVFYAGRGEASGGAANTVWPHSWNVTAGDATPHFYDGVQVDRYACSNEWEGSRPDGIGTFVHEFSHVMGLPDLYATSYTGAFTPGAWSAMDYGPYNNNGCTPPYYGAFERYALGWMEPKTIDGPLTASLMPISENIAGIIRTPNDNEFFLLENRQQQGWDKYVPGHGMLIWHVQYDATIWNRNVVNNTPSRQYVDIEEADGTQTDYSRDGDAFPGASGVTSFTDDTKPSMRTWGGQALGMPVTDIAESADGVITFNVLGGKAGNVSVPEALPASDVTYHSFKANWKLSPETSYYISVFDASTDEIVPGMSRIDVGMESSYVVDGLKSETAYYYVLQAGDGWQFSEFSDKVYVTTGRLPLNLMTVKALPATDITSESFTALWTPIEEADSYMLTVFTLPLTGTNHDNVGFDGDKLPAGWTSNSHSFYSNTAYSGAAIPALRLGSTDERVESPVYEGPVHSVRFWHRGSKADENTRLVIEAYAGGKWTDVTSVPVVTDKGGKTVEVSGLPVGTWAVAIRYIRGEVNGAVAIDDIEVDYGVAAEKVQLGDYADKPMGDVVSHSISGLQPATIYYYTVKATDGVLTSLESEAVEVATLPADLSAIDGVVSDGCSFKVNGRAIAVSGAKAMAEVRLMNPEGMVLRALRAGADGEALVEAPDRGVYLLSIDRVTYKVLIK